MLWMDLTLLFVLFNVFVTTFFSYTRNRNICNHTECGCGTESIRNWVPEMVWQQTIDLSKSRSMSTTWSSSCVIPASLKESKLQLLCGFLPARSLDKLYNFADCAGLHLILGLNALHRNPDNSWNTSSTLSLLKYGAGKKYNISWELGNGQYS